ncbi:acyl-CoA dehydrogenase/oxidase [Spinellus fusiger]|nr:acyl-CoA dehydrogenase/oxidase [Spinellus fusiger]
MSLKQFTRQQVGQHTGENDLWIIIDASVYDMSKFIHFHPGGASPLLEYAGKDATEDFYGLHRQEVLEKYSKYKIGTIANEKPKITMHQHGDFSKVPYAEPSAWMGFKSPYFKETHYKFRAALRVISDELGPDMRHFEETGKKPTEEFMQKLGSYGILAASLGHGPWLKNYTLPGGVRPEEFDYFHEMILHEELSRWGTRGTGDGVMGGMVISIPTVFNFGSAAMKAKIGPEVLSGKKRICLAITEPYAGSDVSKIRATAKKTADGKHYIVNGVKKWITSGHWADYFSVAVQTDKGISMLLIERGEGVETKLIKTAYSSSAGTAYVTFEDVKVPVENLLGKENHGFLVVLSNFNHERWTMLLNACMTARIVIEECFKWAHQRKVFGKRLIDEPVIRNKLASMIAQTESLQSWVENLTYQMCHMDYNEQSDKLAGPIALCKYQSTRVLHNVADDACQIFGGRALTQTGMGRAVEMIQRTYKFNAKVLADLGVRQAMKKFPTDARL